MTTIDHKLPGDTGPGDTSWFTSRQNPFEQTVIRQQVRYRRQFWPGLPNGPYSKQPDLLYPHILPPGNEILSFYQGFASVLLDHMHEHDIAVHTEALNLKSSQVACLNFLFPLHLDPALGVRILQPFFPTIRALTAVEFEYTGQDERNGQLPCTTWLGEPRSGKRGQNRTSIDAALFWSDIDDARHITLIEWKYTERNFGTCSAFEKAPKPARGDCLAVDVLDDPALSCLLAGPGRHRGRNYWKHLVASGLSLPRLATIHGCPFRGPFYQLMRQFLLARFLREQDKADQIELVALEFEGNTALGKLPTHLGPLRRQVATTVLDAFNSVLDDTVSPMRRITAQQYVASCDAASGVDPFWRAYLRNRYGM